jgi:hypothetical protein
MRCEVALIGAQVFMAQVAEREGMSIGGQERGQPCQLGLIRAHRVRAAVRFQLKPADVFRDGGL